MIPIIISHHFHVLKIFAKFQQIPFNLTLLIKLPFFWKTFIDKYQNKKAEQLVECLLNLWDLKKHRRSDGNAPAPWGRTRYEPTPTHEFREKLGTKISSEGLAPGNKNGYGVPTALLKKSIITSSRLTEAHSQLLAAHPARGLIRFFTSFNCIQVFWSIARARAQRE